MTGIEMALLSGLGSALLKGGAQAFGAASAAGDLKLTDEQRRRLKELERKEAESAFGMSKGERDAYQTELLSPVQAAEREAMARFAASQSVADIGQGAAFRQQQALKQTGEAARAETRRALEQRNAQEAEQQQRQLAALRQQEQQRKDFERQAVMSVLGTAGDIIGQTGGVIAKKKFADEEYAKQQADLTGNAKYVSDATQNIFGINTNVVSEGLSNNLANENQQEIIGASMSNASPYSLDGVSAGEAMVANNALQKQLAPYLSLSPEQQVQVSTPRLQAALAALDLNGKSNDISLEEILELIKSLNDPNQPSLNEIATQY